MVILALLAGCRAPAPSVPQVGDFVARLDRFVPHYLAVYGIPGAAVAVVRQGDVVWAKGYGLADRERGTPVTTDTVFQAASISKTLTAWGVMKLVEQGRLDLDAPVERYLTRWRLPETSFDTTGVTVRRLLSHSAGLNVTEYLGYAPGVPLPSIEESLSRGSGKAAAVRLERSPGDGFAYSDGDYLILQLLIEEVSDTPFAEFMHRQVLQPLGMGHSSFAPWPELEAKLASSYDARGKALPSFDFSELAPAGLLTTAPDLARFAAAAVSGPGGEPAGRGVLAPSTLAQMAAPQVSLSGFDAWIYADAYGLGYFVETVPGDQVAISHMGGNLGWLSEMAILPASGDALVVMTNSSLGHEFFAAVVAQWTDWLGLPGTLQVAETIRLAGGVLQLGAVLLVATGLGLLLRLSGQLRSGRRRLAWHWTNPRRMLAIGFPILALLLYFWLAQPFVRASLPGESGLAAAGISLLCTAAVLWGCSERPA
jgi:CubicO group peptidase (beta-lactamase class C family)